MLSFSNSKCRFLPSFVWVFSKLSLSLLAFLQTLKGNWVVSIVDGLMGSMGSASYSCTPLMLLKSNSSCKEGPLPEHIVHPRENKLWLCCQSKHSRVLLGLIMEIQRWLRSHTKEGRERKTDKLYCSSVVEMNSQAQLEDSGTEKEFPQRWWKRKAMVFYQFSKELGFFFEHWQTFCVLSWFFGF